MKVNIYSNLYLRQYIYLNKLFTYLIVNDEII